MAEKSNTNIYWYIVLPFIIVLFVSAAQIYTGSQLTNPEINGTLTNESIEYILKVNGIDISDFNNVTKDQAEKDEAITISNETGAQPKDFALEFFYSRSQASRVGIVAKSIFSFPGFVTTLLSIPVNSVNWIIGILNWFWRIALGIAVYYFIRGLK